jgi:PII-like signaling protein
MKLSGDGKLLRIFLGELDKHGQKPLYEAIVLKAREMGFAGATVLRGIQGFGADSRIVHTAKILRLSEDLPIVVEIVDTEENIRKLIPVIDEMLETAACGALVTIEKAEIIRYTPGGQRSD